MNKFVERFEDDVYIVPAGSHDGARQDVFSRLVLQEEMTAEDWYQVRDLQGGFATQYLRLRYGDSNTRLMLISEHGCLLSILWVVPANRIRSKYHFVESGTYAIISCITRQDARGRALYPHGIRRIAASGIASRYYIWAHKDNVASVRGIEKTGGIKVGSFVRERWFRGLFSSICFSASEAK